MGTSEGAASRKLAESLFVLLLVSAVARAAIILPQRKADVRKSEASYVRKTESGAEVRAGFNDIPDATEPCTPEESDWWKKLRIAAHEVMKKNGQNSEPAKTRFYVLLYEGQQKSFRVPLKDRPHQVLAFGSEPMPHDKALKMQITGNYVFSIEFRADASIGDVRMVKGANSLIAENIIKSTKQYVFLPAVKDRAFVSDFGEVRLSFSDKWTKKPKDAEIKPHIMKS